MVTWSGLLAPRNTPAATLNVTTQALPEWMADPKFRADMQAKDHVPATPEAMVGMGQVIQSDKANGGALVTAADIRLE